MRTITDMWEELDIVNVDIQKLIDQRQQIDEWLREAIEERTEIIREIENNGGEIDWG